MAFSQEDAIRKVIKAWSKWNDKAVKQEEKATIKPIIEKMLAKYGLDLDWKTGKVTGKGQAKQENKQENKQEAKKEEKQSKKTKQGMSTKDLIDYIFNEYGIEWTGKNLRRKIRQMPRWNDDKVTHYDFTKAEVIEILVHLGYIKESKVS